MLFTKEALGTKLKIEVFSGENFDFSVIDRKIEAFEKKYSRFIKGNYLYTLNAEKKGFLSPEMRGMVQVAQKVSMLSEGYFDITLLPYLENNGYGIFSKKMDTKNTGMEHILLDTEKNEIVLKNNISLDLGGLGKGYLIDTIFHILQKNIKNFLINFGGDIRISGEKNIFLEDPGDTKKVIGDLILTDTSFASSAQNKRSGHIINSQLGASENKKLAVYVLHKNATFSDAFATALFAAPLEICKKVIKKVPGLEVLVIMKDGEILQTKNCPIKLYVG